MTEETTRTLPWTMGLRRDEMLEPEDVSAMLKLKALGWGARPDRGGARMLADDGPALASGRRLAQTAAALAAEGPRRTGGLARGALSPSCRQRRRGSPGACHREGQEVSLRTVERAVAHLRQERHAEARATVRFERRPGEQLQIDFGQRRVEIAGVPRLVSFFVATLGYSRRLHVRAFLGERQEHWFSGMESTFATFGGVPAEVLLDNARALILSHDPASRELVLNPRLHAVARHWGFQVRACAPYRPRSEPSKAIGSSPMASGQGRARRRLCEAQCHRGALLRASPPSRPIWSAGRGRSLTSGCMARPARRRWCASRATRQPGSSLSPTAVRSSQRANRRVGSDCAVEFDTNACSVPWRLIGERVRVPVTAETVRITHAGIEVACHRRSAGRRGRITDRAHFDGGAGAAGRLIRVGASEDAGSTVSAPALLRPLAEYEAVAGGAW